MARHKDANWILPEKVFTTATCQLAVLMDLRDELKRLNNLLHCNNFIQIPQYLRGIRRNTTKKRRTKI